MEKPIKDVTIADLALGSDAFRDVVLSVLETIVEIGSQDASGRFADHLLRRVFVNGDSMKYDPGDEPAMKLV
jgi:hypothetical protein